ncbi:MAG: 4-alpha-glucanotransferase [Bacillota bacterium]|nr:4-alpha-glucanotransferase [Bacillota bacterium]
MKRATGVLLSVTSLPSPYGIGCFSKEAYDFVDWLVEARQTYWQILPLGPTAYGESGDSPYQAYSAFAGNPYLIDLTPFIEKGYLSKKDLSKRNMTRNASQVDYDKLHQYRYELLHIAYEKSQIHLDPDYQKFIKENAWWLDDYSLFMALHNFFKDVKWQDWPEDIRLRYAYSLDYYRKELYFDIEFQKFLQYHFFSQWHALKEYANKKGIQIVGDMPIYVSLDSADVWSHPELFQLNEDLSLKAMAGCPPDMFSETGQVWGNPLYNWDYHKQTNYQWWTSRVWSSFQMFDVCRIDHFRGFDEYYSIPAGEETAIHGHWEKGPSLELFQSIEKAIGKRHFMAEDLGFQSEGVRQLVKNSGYPNMKVFQFGFDPEDSGATNDYLPHNYHMNCWAYTGTHDNDTTIGWYKSLSKKEQALVLDYLGKTELADEEITWSMIRAIFQSHAIVTIVPMQDYLSLDSCARMNLPSTATGNWSWRMKKGSTTKKLAQQMKKLALIYGRANWN